MWLQRITKVSATTIDDADHLDLVMPMNNLLEYISNYSDTTGSLWFYSKDEATNFGADIEDKDEFKSFKYKTKLIRSTVVSVVLENVVIAVSLKYISNFSRSP